jgi:RNA 2',3'-cyclic 3'-phosphodiesterase
MRTFIGTSIQPAKASAIASMVAPHLNSDQWRAAPVEQWHVTTLFIGEIPSELLDSCLFHVEKIAASTPVITLVNGRLCTMPADAPRMLWIKFDPHPALSALHLELADALGAEPSRHIPYQPHITLARSRKDPTPVDGPMILKELLLDHLTLFRTEFSPAGSIHHAMVTWPLN